MLEILPNAYDNNYQSGYFNVHCSNEIVFRALEAYSYFYFIIILFRANTLFVKK